MSLIGIAWAWDQDVGTPVGKLVLMHLADSANEADGDETYYGLLAIAKRCNCHRATVIRQLALLESTGYITLVQRAEPGKKGNRYRVEYRLSVVAREALRDARADAGDESSTKVPDEPPVAECDQSPETEPVAECDQSERGGGRRARRGGRTVRPGVVAERDPNPYLLTQTNQQPREEAVDNLERPDDAADPDTPPDLSTTSDSSAGPPLLDIGEPLLDGHEHELVVDEERAQRLVRKYLDCIAECGYQTRTVISKKALKVLGSWARSGLAPSVFSIDLRSAMRGSTSPIKYPIEYLHAKYGPRAPLLRDLDAAPDASQLERQRMKDVVKGGDPSTALAAAGVRRPAPEVDAS